MRLLAATTTIVSVATLVFASASHSTATAATSAFVAGDQLVYAITAELQQHHVPGSSKNQDNVTESSAQGTATFTVYSIGADGTAYATVAFDFKGQNEGQPVEFQSVTPGKILPDGQLRTKAQVGLGVSDALGAANTTAGEVGQNGLLAVGKSWTNASKTPFVVLSVTRRIVGKTNYQGFTAYALVSEGTGTLLKTADGRPTSGTITVSGTTYYDGQDRLLIGEALRTLTVVQQAGSGSAHDDYSAAFNVVLNAWTHASPVPGQSQEPEGTQASPQPQETGIAPTPTPLLYGPSPYPTITPRLGS